MLIITTIVDTAAINATKIPAVINFLMFDTMVTVFASPVSRTSVTRVRVAISIFFFSNMDRYYGLTKFFTPPVWYAEVQRKAVDDGEMCAEVQTFCESRGAVQRCATMRQAVRKECAA